MQLSVVALCACQLTTTWKPRAPALGTPARAEEPLWQTLARALQAIMTTEDLSLGDALLDRLCTLTGQDVNPASASDERVNTRLDLAPPASRSAW